MKEAVLKINQIVSTFFTKGHQRSIAAKKNIFASFLIKGVSIGVNLLLVPMTIHYVNPTQYGIWLTLSSIVAWFSFFDIGFGNGLRNKFAEAKAKGDLKRAREYVSTTYAVLSIIFTIVWFLFFVVNYFLDWSLILNAPSEMAAELSLLALVVFSFFCLQMVLRTINTVLIADQKPAKSAFFDMLGQVLVLSIVFILTQTTKGSLIYLGVVIGLAPILILIISSLFFYTKTYRFFAPSIGFVRFKLLNDIMGLGYRFFIVQVAAIILFTTSNILITQFYGPEEVTAYNIAYKYFSLVSMGFGIIVAPFWSAITDAYYRKDLGWIRGVMKKLDFLAIIFVAVCLFMLLIADKVFMVWIGEAVKVPISITIVMAFYFIVNVLALAPNTFINGTGKIQLQFYTAIFSIVFTIPLAFLFCKYFDFGPAGVVAASLTTTLPCMILFRIQYKKIMSGNVVGLWNS
ncbi:MAG: oligosaccharide flippase family protein [Bacteroidales bacterium]|nr:oligosaccharide flippase family protein [Bacteroidales bacterium]